MSTSNMHRHTWYKMGESGQYRVNASPSHQCSPATDPGLPNTLMLHVIQKQIEWK